MKRPNRIAINGLVIAAVLILLTGFAGYCLEELVRAKIGVMVKSKGKAVRAKAKGVLKPGDLVRVYVQPEKKAYVYVVHTDSKTATLLNPDQKQVDSAMITLPSVQDHFEVDGTSTVEKITIVCSPKDIPKVSDLLKAGEAPHSKWAALESELYETSKIDLTSKAERPFTIAGNVRGGPEKGDPFLKKLRIYTGKSLVVKRYEFRVKR